MCCPSFSLCYEVEKEKKGITTISGQTEVVTMTETSKTVELRLLHAQKFRLLA